MLICSVCGKLNPEGSRNCDLCGAPLAGADRQSATSMPAPIESGASSGLSGPICPKCRRPNRAASVFCAFCGYRLQDSNGAQPYTLPGNGSNGHSPANPYSVGKHPTTVIASDEAGNIPAGTLLKKRYHIIRKIAQGGMGAVYESTDTHAPQGTRWAVKEMSPAALPASERRQAVADFRREAQMLASLHHPNLPTVVETFEEFGKNFLVMEFVPGRTLQNIIDATPGFIPEERITVWARQLCDVIGYLHGQNPPIIYRDIKPANVMLVENTERIKLIDFGIARFHKAGKSRDTEAFGTAGYAPPEQYGKGQTDQRSDIYALAATLHYLLTKHDPGLNPFNWLPVRRYNPAISTRMEEALQVALNLDPQRRFTTIQDFGSAMGIAVSQPAMQTAAPVPEPTPVAPPVVTFTPAPKPAPVAKPAAKDVQPPIVINTPRSKPAPSRPWSRPAAGAAAAAAASAATAAAASAAPAAAAAPVAAPKIGAPSSQRANSPTTKQKQTNAAAQAAPIVINTPASAPAQAPIVIHTPQPAPDGVDKGTTSTDTPALVVSDKIVDMGEVKWNSKTVSKLALRNAGGGQMKGTVVTNQPWVALNMQSFNGNAQTIEIRVKKRDLSFGRVELRVPNLFAIIWARTRWALPLIAFWLWVLLLVASSLGQRLLWVALGTVGALVLAEVLMWWWAWHVRLLVPAEKLNTGRLLVKSSGGEQQIEVRAKARPSGMRIAFGWALAVTLMVVELALLVWGVLVAFGYEIPIPGLL